VPKQLLCFLKPIADGQIINMDIVIQQEQHLQQFLQADAEY
jgi:hypothetical protein